MKTVGWLVVVVGLVLLGTGVPRAEENFDGNELLPKCATALRLDDPAQLRRATWQEMFDRGYCQGVLAGVMAGSMHLSLAPAYVYCLPSFRTPTSQIVRVVLAYLQTHPARLHLSHTTLVIEALRDAFPCTP
jgi:hypothetical protein